MNTFKSYSNSTPALSNLPGLPRAQHTVPTDTSSSEPGIAGYSTHILHSFFNKHLNLAVMDQVITIPTRSLNDFSIYPIPSTENEIVVPPYYSQEVLDEIVPCDLNSNVVNDDYPFIDSTSENYHPIAQKSPSVNASVSFSQPSTSPVVSPVVIVGPLNKDTQQQMNRGTVKFKPTEPSGSREPLPPVPGKVRTSGTGNASKTKYAVSEKGKANKARYAASEKGKASKAKSNAKYRASKKGKESQARYAASDKGRRSLAIRNKKTNTYHSALIRGFSKEVAREIAKSAADVKKAELLSESPPSPTPFSHLTEGIFSIPIDPVSP